MIPSDGQALGLTREDSLQGFEGEKVNASQKVTDSIRDGRQRAMMSVDDVAMEIGCCSRSVRRWVDSGRMPKPIKLGSLVRWPRSVIEQWIAEGCPNVRNSSKGRK